MTTEIVILNRQGIALAADSAVTTGRQRVWKTANKLFSLGPAHDIGIMIHGSADVSGVLWENIIKMFRRECQSKCYNTVEECSEDFIEFSNRPIFDDLTLQQVGLAARFIDILNSAKSHIKYESKKEFRENAISYMKSARASLDDEFQIVDIQLSLEKFSEEWSKDIKALAGEVFEEVITAAVLNAILGYLHAFVIRNIQSEYSTGIVMAGFGDSEILPVANVTIFDGKFKSINRCWRDSRSQNLNTDEDPGGVVLPFGQMDIISLIIEGISAETRSYISSLFGRILKNKSDSLVRRYISDADERVVEGGIQSGENRKIMEMFKEELGKFHQINSINPILSVVNALPKEEMASMAEALVDITALRRRVDSSLESVGGPVDVAVISKGDGFIWIKRKHYFNIEMNRDFLYRKHPRGGS
ncbi:hypothetical protein [Phenylobacterium aquaticum]|uniref:hypothetical protein n=1 Tax=Phenylobacterium aquaticum TaxID=1763816 RepID=UPI001F5DE1B5|nr:hypothetical protein [Phenylobacterium aquaticum]MCI3133926.1 hypothetical protein [Phenylobacterium aquaticum]